METIKIKTEPCYDVLIGKGLLTKAGELVAGVCTPCKAVIVADDIVAPLYLNTVKASLEASGFQVCEFVFENGEKSKNISTFSALLEFMAENKITRSDIVVALGGGVTGDMTGFGAAVYLRGIKFVQIPTTLLAMVDSSVGGKTAIDLIAGKNLAGAFYQPSLVICDPNTLDTLSEEIFAQGMAEVIKYGVIFDRELFENVKSGDVKNNIESIIKRCVELKESVVEKDQFDNGERQLLNFGHTIGHAVEKCSSFEIPHGNAVAIGMVIVARASSALNFSDEDCTGEIVDALKNNSLPVECSFSAEELFKNALNDKKRAGDFLNLIVPEKIGKCVIKKIEANDLLQFIKNGTDL